MSQGLYNVPTGGSISMVTFAGLMNSAYNALASQNSGASAPANGPGSAAQEFQTWFDITNVNFPILKIYDGVNWDKVGTLDVANSNWIPKMGGGVATLTSAATVNIGASPQTFITITGTTSITSFGTAATIGEERKLQFSGALQITYNAGAIITPGLQNVNVLPGDHCTAIYEGSSIWTLFGFTRAYSAPGFQLPSGATFWMPSKNVAVTGAVRANGRTIGSAASPATELASLSAYWLYVFLYQNFPDATLPVSGGRSGNANTDFNANKTITLPDLRGRVPAGLDDMGNSAASRLTSLTMSPDGITALASGGAQTVTLGTANLPAYTPAGTATDSGHTHGISPSATNLSPGGTWAPAGGGSVSVTSVTQSGTANITFAGTAQGGTSTAVNNIQPTVTGTWYICL